MFRILVPFLLASTLASLAPLVNAREFTDDRGVTFTWPDDGAPPTVVVNADGALSLFHMGMTNQQIVGVWDKWIVRGSDIDITADDVTSHFEADPNKQELDFLFSVRNLSPNCFDDNQGCTREFDAEALGQLNPDFTIMIHHGPYPEITDQIQQTTGNAPIYIDSRFEDNEGCRTGVNFEATDTSCYARSVIDVIQRVQDLADFLGVPRTAKVQQEEQKMCEAANEFSLLAKQLHDRGVRCVAATVRVNNGGSINMINLNQLPWLRTFEELGLPLIHPPLQQSADFTRTYDLDEWFPKCNSGGGDACEDLTPVLPADCYLLDSRSFAALEESREDVLAFLPLEALRQQQYTSLLFNDGAISYTTAAAILREATQDLAPAQPLYSKTSCTPVDVTSKDHTSLSYGGLEGGEYACYDKTTLEQEMLTCPDPYTPTGNFGSITNESPSFSNGGSPNGGSSSAASTSTAPGQVIATGLISLMASFYLMFAL